jgi:hypothetical protein
MRAKTLAAAACIILAAACARAQTQPVFTVGGTLWHAKPSYSGDLYEDVTARAGNMIGPYLNVRMGNWLLGASMFFGSFKIEEEFDEGDFEIDMKRNDLNFSLGYSVAKNLSLFGAVKNISVAGDQTDTFEYDDGYYYNEIDVETEMKNKGTLFGGGASTVFQFENSPLFLFGSAAYLTGTLKSSFIQTVDGEEYYDYDEDVDRTLISWNMGIGYRAPSGLSLLLGYRGDTTTGADMDEGKENISGIMATVALTLQ